MKNLANSLLLALVVTFLANLIAMPLALIQQRYEFFGKRLLGALVLVPLVLPPFVGAMGMKQLLAKFGSLTILLQHLGILPADQGINWLHMGGGRGGFWACAILITLGLYPIAYLNLQAALANIDPAMREAAENLGGRRFTIFRRITLPLAMPGLFAGSTLIFIWALTELGTPLLLDYPFVVSRTIYDLTASATAGDWGQIGAMVTLLLLITLTIYLVGKQTLGRRSYAMTSKAVVGATTRKLGLGRGLLACVPFGAVSFLAMLPHLGVVLYSFTAIAIEPGWGWGQAGVFGWYRSVIPSRFTLAGYAAVFQMPEIYGSILNSIKYASIATALDLALGVAIAWMVVRTKLFGRFALDALAMLPLAVPGLIMAYGYFARLSDLAAVVNGLIHTYNGLLWLISHGKFAPVGDVKILDLQMQPLLILVIAYGARRLPYMVRSTTAGLEQTSVTLEEAAANMGARPWRRLWRITLPLILANLIAGALLTFSFSMLEVSDSLILSQFPQGYPITRAIYALGSDTSGADNVRNACALGVLAMTLLIGTLVTASLLMGKKLGAVFRA